MTNTRAANINTFFSFWENNKIKNVVSLLAGILLATAFAPLNWLLASYIAPLMLLLIWLHSSTKQATLTGFLFGLGFFGAGASWVFVSIHTFGNTNSVLAALFTLLFICVLALFPALNGLLLNFLFKKNNLIKRLFIFPALWVLCEWLRGWFLGGFPWLLLGYSQLHTPLRGLAPLFGVYSVSFTALVSVGALSTAFEKDIPLKAVLILVCLWLFCFFLSVLNWTQPINKKIPVTIIQANVPQTIKWQPQQVNHILHEYTALTLAHWQSGIMVWPEGAITVLYRQAKPFLTNLSQQASQHKTSLVLGIPLEKQQKFYNAMLAIGQGHGIYLKRHLVPFGEYLPFEWLRGLINFFNIPMSNFSPGPTQQALLNLNHVKTAGFICYEIAYPDLVAKSTHHSHLLLTISDDSWFGKSIATWQHLQIAEMRSLETGRYQIYATNSGPSAIINPLGRLQMRSLAFKQEVLRGDVQAMQGNTPFMLYGSWPFLLILVVFLALIGLISRKN